MIRPTDAKLTPRATGLQATVSFAAHIPHQEACHEEFGP
ncbi:hypothetical protein ABIE58_000080 [Roseovarius sp. MBR-78]